MCTQGLFLAATSKSPFIFIKSLQYLVPSSMFWFDLKAAEFIMV